MSDFNALAKKLAELASNDEVFDSGARVISEGGTPAPLAAILREVDDTVLERKLALESAGTTINLIASGRRLRGILSVTPDKKSNVIGQSLSREEPGTVQAAHDLLHELCGDADRLTVRNYAPEPFGQTGERGISALGLSDLWQVDLDEAPKPPMERFLTANATAFSSLLHIRQGEVVATSGEIKALKAIWKSQMEDFRKTHKKALSGEDGPQLITLDGALEEGASAAVAVYEKDLALIAYQSDQFGRMQSSWQRIFT